MDQFSSGGPENVPLGEMAFGEPQVAADSRGEMLIVWPASDDLGHNIYGQGVILMSEFRDGSWSDPSSLSDAISIGSTEARLSNPSVAMSDNGDAVIAWRQDEAIYEVEYRGGSWSTAARIDPPDAPGGSSTAQVAMDSHGNAVIAWLSAQDGCANYPCCRLYRSEYFGGAWTHPASAADSVPTATVAGGCRSEIDVAMGGNGDAVIAWGQRRSDRSLDQIFMSERRNGVWMDPSSLSDDISLDEQSELPVAAMSENGEAVIAWIQREATGSRVLVSEYRSGAWHHPADTAGAPVSESAAQREPPSVAMAGNGDTIIAWAQPEGAFKRERRNGVWAEPTTVASTMFAFDASSVHAAMNASGDATIVWNQWNGQRTRVYRADFRNNQWTQPLEPGDFISPLETETDAPNVALGSKGVIIWRQGEQFSSSYDTWFLDRVWF